MPSPELNLNTNPSLEPTANPPSPTPSPAPPALSPEEEARLAKARQDEKDKIYARLKAQADESAELKKKLAALEAARDADKAAKDKIAAAAKKKADDEKRAQMDELGRLKDDLDKQQKAHAASLAALKADQEKMAAAHRDAQLALLREKAIREAGLTDLGDLVQGHDAETIKASADMLKKREEAIRQKTREQEASARGNSVPTKPITPGNGQPAGDKNLSAAERSRLRNLTPAEWKAERAAALEKAHEALKPSS